MILASLAAAITRAMRAMRAIAASATAVDIFGDFHPRPFILGLAAGLIAPHAVRLLAWVL